MSPRRMGKSKLVKFCYDKPEITDNFYTFYIDILHTSGLREFTYVFGQKVFEVLHSRSQKMFTALVQGLKSINAKFGFDPINNTPTFSIELGDISRPEYTLTEIFDCLEHTDKPCIVAFDEFQQIMKYPEKTWRRFYAHISSSCPMCILSLQAVKGISFRKCSCHRPALSITVRR